MYVVDHAWICRELYELYDIDMICCCVILVASYLPQVHNRAKQSFGAACFH